VVNDDCEQCGHCTATCTSNVRVHEEVRLYGMVVDPGCMKCTDCVSVCPNGALSFSFARPSLLKKPPAARRARKFDLPVAEELLVAIVAVAATLAFRDLYNGPPLLMSVGLGGITAFLALKLWHLVRQKGVKVQNLELKSSGRMLQPGWVFATLSVVWLAFTSHSAFAQWHRARGRHYLDQTEVSHADGLSGVFRASSQSDRHTRAAAESFRHFALADRWGLTGVVEVKLGLAWGYLLRRDLENAEREARAALELAPNNPDLKQNLLDIQHAASAEARFSLATELADAGRLDDAAVEFEAAVAGAPDSAAARFNLGGVLRRLGRNQEAIEQLSAAERLSPEDPEIAIELGLAHMAVGANEAAVAAFERAIALNPESAESRAHLPELIRKLADSPGAH
jgi:thioredoxin-like negative regulator of GroEL/NAD-dependent dihydropyrimidine dehydrogenase PreA subunit